MDTVHTYHIWFSIGCLYLKRIVSLLRLLISLNFFVRRLDEKPVKWMSSKLYGDLRWGGRIKTSLTKYSIEFNDFAVQRRPHRIPYLRLLGRPYTLLYVGLSADTVGLKHVIELIKNPSYQSQGAERFFSTRKIRNIFPTFVWWANTMKISRVSYFQEKFVGGEVTKMWNGQ